MLLVVCKDAPARGLQHVHGRQVLALAKALQHGRYQVLSPLQPVAGAAEEDEQLTYEELALCAEQLIVGYTEACGFRADVAQVSGLEDNYFMLVLEHDSRAALRLVQYFKNFVHGRDYCYSDVHADLLRLDPSPVLVQ